VIDGKTPTTPLPGVAWVPAASSHHPCYAQVWVTVPVADAGPAATGTSGPGGSRGTDTTSTAK
jgi:hypothetical protein